MKTTTKKINGFDVNIIQFSALEALSIRKELVKSLKEQIGNSSLNSLTELNFKDIGSSDLSKIDINSVIKSIAGILYELPTELMLKLFKNCSAEGALSDEKNFNRVFENNIDGAIELAMEVVKFNGFFSLTTILQLANSVAPAK